MLRFMRCSGKMCLSQQNPTIKAKEIHYARRLRGIFRKLRFKNLISFGGSFNNWSCYGHPNAKKIKQPINSIWEYDY
jgi:hypothetical protein